MDMTFGSTCVSSNDFFSPLDLKIITNGETDNWYNQAGNCENYVRSEMQSAGVSNVRSMESEHKPLVILRCKCVVVGDACVGKTALTQVFHSGGSTYPKNYVMVNVHDTKTNIVLIIIQTIGAEFCVKQVPIPDTNAIVELYVFDCAGQSIFNQVEMNSKYVMI